MRMLIAILTCLTATAALAQSAPPDPAGSAADKVVVSGTLPSEAVRAKVLERLRTVYGADKVVDHTDVGQVITPGNWDRYVTGMIGPQLKQVSHGEITVKGNQVTVSGEVPNEVQKQQVLSKLASAFNNTYAFHSKLRIGESEQQTLDQALGDRTIEFRSGSATLTDRGIDVLNEMAAAIGKLHDPKIMLIGHTDSSGNRQANIQLSLDRANAVRNYLVSKNISADSMTVKGLGPDQPIADNTTAEGRARNRRIEFKLQH